MTMRTTALAYAALLLISGSSFCAAAPKVTIRIVPRTAPEETVAPVGPVPFRAPMVYYQGLFHRSRRVLSTSVRALLCIVVLIGVDVMICGACMC